MQEEQAEKTITVTMTRRVTQAWKDSARVNGAKAKAVVQTEEHRAKLREAWKGRKRAVCDCGRTDGTHTSGCAGYNAWKQRESRERKKQAQEGATTS